MNTNDLRFQRARIDFPSFLDYVYILDPPPKGKGIIKLEKWPHILEVAHTFLQYRLISWLKARQIGASWELAAYDLWVALYQTGANVLLYSQGEPEAQDKLAKCSFIYSKLPPELQTPIGADNKGEMTFPDMYSSIRALPSTQKAGRSSTGTLVDMDEADFHEYFELNYNAVKPIIDDNGGQLIITSTSNAYLQDTLFKRIYKGAPGNNFYTIFYPWNVRPGRDDDWYYARSLEYDDPFQFTKEYPSSAEQALAPPKELRAFDTDILEEMERDCRDPIETYADTHIFQHFQPGRRYAAGTDTSHGLGGDDAVTALLDLGTGQVVADVHSAFLPPEQLAFQSDRLLRIYGSPIWAIEENDWGALTIKKALELEYPNLFYRDDFKMKKAGWHTNRRTRPQLWGELVGEIKARALIIPSRLGLKQFYNVQRDPSDGRIGGMGKSNDDYPMAVGLCIQMRPFARVSRIANFMDHRERGSARLWGIP